MHPVSFHEPDATALAMLFNGVIQTDAYSKPEILVSHLPALNSPNLQPDCGLLLPNNSPSNHPHIAATNKQTE
ncbi:hypothetical protein N7508_008723 [Penicillium antarcticum]|uniref:uncharacterized protein n=1 Tax=Penicillium antarcticum TaxID=416450 RepID=UPI0023A1342B|nr:uncharacterized protein N7508_008723 [Penicillium antarcticum]KAJ5293902.1 hypothetical protein N7508_008723 [Penicillium antarcticum]